MKTRRVIGGVLAGLAGVLPAVARALVSVFTGSETRLDRARPKQRQTVHGGTKWVILATLAGVVLVTGLGVVMFLYSGVYDMAAIHPHSRFVRPVLLTLKRNSVEYHAQDLEVPELARPGLVKRGLVLYRKSCVTCHGAPGEARSKVGRGLNPNPPPLETAAENWTPAQIAWITSNGLKMAGMPGFSLGEEPDDLWALTAFVIRMNALSPEEYREMVAATEGSLDESEVAWLAPDPGWRALEERGNQNLGVELIERFGCGSCHVIPGIAGANGSVGPPLAEWSKRHYIAGALVNNPNGLVRWMMNPQEVEPGTVMPDLNVGKEEAWSIARYLYSLGQEDGEPPREGLVPAARD